VRREAVRAPPCGRWPRTRPDGPSKA
jgi:hypothetical protein